VVQSAFSPSKSEVEAAMRLVAAFKEHQDQGRGAFVFEGGLLLIATPVIVTGTSGEDTLCAVFLAHQEDPGVFSRH
jgi:hypothetical protein